MRVLLIKTSSMGDVIHTFPAINDAYLALPSLEVDWVVEEGFAELPRWHPAVKNVITVPFRRMRKQGQFSFKLLRAFFKTIRANQYDLVLDAQGLFKSAIIARAAKGERHGFDRQSAREGGATYFYQKRHVVSRQQHAILRTRQLFSKALGYAIPNVNSLACGLVLPAQTIDMDLSVSYLVFLHGTTWQTKHYPESEWETLIQYAAQAGFFIYLGWGNESELARANRFAVLDEKVKVLPRTTLLQMAHVLEKAKGVVSVDTGLGHLAAALSKPLVALYGPTDPKLTGMLGDVSLSLSSEQVCSPCLQDKCKIAPESLFSPCFNDLPSHRVWQTLQNKMKITSIGINE